MTGALPAGGADRFTFLLEHMPRVAEAVAAFSDPAMRLPAFRALLEALSTPPVPSDADAAVRENAVLTAQLAKLGDFLGSRYPGAFPISGTVVDSAIHVLSERWAGPTTTNGSVDRLAAFISDNVPGEPSRSESAVDTAIRLIGAHLACPKPTDLRRARPGPAGGA